MEGICQFCEEPIQSIRRPVMARTDWVCVRSGDVGGTYDYCEVAADHRHLPRVRPD
jgi:hypothetical protein